MPDLNLIINGYTPPVPDEGGIDIKQNKVWSKNTGRTASGLMVGDIVTRKYSLTISWSKLNGADIKNLDNAINSKEFFSVKFTNQKGEVLTRNFYSDDTLYKQKKYKKDDVEYSDISVALVEQ